MTPPADSSSAPGAARARRDVLLMAQARAGIGLLSVDLVLATDGMRAAEPGRSGQEEPAMWRELRWTAQGSSTSGMTRFSAIACRAAIATDSK